MQPGPPYQPPHQGPYQQGPPPPGYGYGGPPPQQPNNRGRIVVLVSLAVAVLAAGGITAIVLTSGGGDSGGGVSALDTTTPRRQDGPPDKYPNLPTCQDIVAKVPDLPPLEQDTATQGPKSGSTYPELYLSCTFKSADATGGRADQIYEIEATAHLTDPRGYPTGTGEAASTFEAGLNNGNEEARGLGLGDRAAWVRSSGGGGLRDCPVKILDGNVEIEVRRAGATDPASQATDTEGCRTPTKELATKLYRATVGQ